MRELEAEGFTPVETLFCEVEFARAWPQEHRREVRDDRFEQTGQEPIDEDELRLSLVRSPWPSIDLDVVVKLMFRWLRRNEDRFLIDKRQHTTRVDTTTQLAVVAEFFRQPETWVRAYGEGRVNRLV